MAWTDPTTRATGFLVTAAVYNADIINNLIALASPGDYRLIGQGSAGHAVESAIRGGWLECNGAAVSRTTYAKLWTYFQTLFAAKGSGTTTLGSAIANGTATSITLSSYPSTWPGGATGTFPSGTPFEILIDSEKMLVTAGWNTTTLTVTRACEGTSGVSHSNGVTVALVTENPYGSGDGSTTFNVPDLYASTPWPVGTKSNIAALGQNSGVTYDKRNVSHHHSAAGNGANTVGLVTTPNVAILTTATSGDADNADAPAYLVAGIWAVKY